MLGLEVKGCHDCLFATYFMGCKLSEWLGSEINITDAYNSNKAHEECPLRHEDTFQVELKQEDNE